MATIISPNFGLSDLDFPADEPREPNSLAGEDLHYPAEETQLLSRDIFDINVSSLLRTYSSLPPLTWLPGNKFTHWFFLPDSRVSETHSLRRYESPKLTKDALLFIPKLSTVRNKEQPDSLRVTGTVSIFERDGHIQRDLILNLDLDNSTLRVAVSEIKIPFLVEQNWSSKAGWEPRHSEVCGPGLDVRGGSGTWSAV